ncbi:MAG TPA: GNAT family N-acetyltransferase, partial [Chloroflexi bacterium]|nr:GNAT family N-acetyltransferase [Chloroflexota bacterium]
DVVRQRQPPIRIQALTADTLGDVDQCDNSFTIQNRLSLFMQDEQLHYKVTPLAPPREKHTPPEVEDYTPYLTDPDKAIFLAYVDNQVVGQIVLRKYWNGYAYIQDLAVETQFRRQGIGRALIDQAVNWARAQSLPGLMLETQDINVPACRFYARYGFTLCGFNTHLYRGLPTPLDEVALYWYLLF